MKDFIKDKLPMRLKIAFGYAVSPVSDEIDKVLPLESIKLKSQSGTNPNRIFWVVAKQNEGFETYSLSLIEGRLEKKSEGFYRKRQYPELLSNLATRDNVDRFIADFNWQVQTFAENSVYNELTNSEVFYSLRQKLKRAACKGTVHQARDYGIFAVNDYGTVSATNAVSHISTPKVFGKVLHIKDFQKNLK